MLHFKKAASLALGSLLLLTACGGGGNDAEAVTATTLDELYEAAKSEGQVVIYGPTEDLYGAVYEDFKKEYPGIDLVTSDIFGQELDSRLEGEQVAGGFDADLVHIGVSDVERYNDRGYLAPFKPMEADALDSAYIGPDNMWSVPSQHLYASAYNTNVLSAEEMPTTWDDLADSALSGQIATSNPKQSGVVPQMISAAMDAGTLSDFNKGNIKAGLTASKPTPARRSTRQWRTRSRQRSPARRRFRSWPVMAAICARSRRVLPLNLLPWMTGPSFRT